MYISHEVSDVIIRARQLAEEWKHEYVTSEHVLIAMCEVDLFKEAFGDCGGDIETLKNDLTEYLHEAMITTDLEPIESFSLQQAFIWASQQVINSGKDQIEIDHVLSGIMHQPESYSAYYIEVQDVTLTDLLYELCHVERDMDDEDEAFETSDEDYEDSERDFGTSEEILESEEEIHSHTSKQSASNAMSKVSKYVTNLNELVKKEQEPLVGREDIIERTIQILCRKQKNNPVHIGEPGVGKTAITKGLAKRISEGKVPSTLKDAVIFELDLGATLAGTQYRGDFEKRLKKILDALKKQKNPIVYIDEIHNIVGAGSLGGGSLDASNLLKPYLTQSHIRFIGATTYEEYKKYFEKDKGLVRRFQSVEVKEPTVDETIEILNGLKAHYEAYHGVTYTKEAIEGAAKLSHQYINDRFLPDKAIDLLDEAGAHYRAGQIEDMDTDKKQMIDLSIIEATLARICHIPKQKVEKDEIQVLKNLEGRLKKQVFGQDEAVDEIVRSIKLSRAGLSNGEKPVANLLFVGPTGVGKTELAKSLSEELGVKLIRFDMSEYTEKHTASKLIGSPPGYVGYEEGGLLTDAIRKNPYCILLLDEIEKAHSDIFNILLQVMDYATLTDNQGRKADFRNIILIMTSNAGASQIGKKLVGFGERTVEKDAIDEAVKKTFTPEFRNRLTKIVAFRHINEEMALLITKKQLNVFKEQLKERNIELSFSKKVVSHIAEKGISNEYGAREIARIIEGKIKPLLVDEILFGKLKKGGKAKIDLKSEEYQIVID
ncbi:MAG: AAA family ATPase [Cellulosilyticum sp.]|nr:AAA family ATPase [Cellulosilyticum sp.]